MSKFDEATSTFTLACSEDQHCAAFKRFTSEGREDTAVKYFDVNVQMGVRDNNISLLLSSTRLRSHMECHLDLDSSYPLPSTSMSPWTLVIAVLLVVALVLSAECSQINKVFFANVGYEVMSILILYQVHVMASFIVIYSGYPNDRKFNTLFALVYFSTSMFFIKLTLDYMRFGDEVVSADGGAVRASCLSRYLRCCNKYGVSFCILAMGAVSLKLMYWKSIYSYFLYLVFSFPLLQVFITCYRARDEDVFRFSYQICCWSCCLYPLVLFKSSLFSTVNVSPDDLLVVYALLVALFGVVFMWLQSVYGVYFFKFWIPRYMRFVNPPEIINIR